MIPTPDLQPKTAITKYDEDKLSLEFFVAERGVRTLSVLVGAVLLTLTVLGTLHYVKHGDMVTLINIPTIFILIAVLVLLHTGHLRVAFMIFLWSLVAGGLYTGFVVAGMLSPALLFLPLATILTAWLLGRRHAIGMALICALGIIVVATLQTRGLLPNQTRDPYFWALCYIIDILMGAYFALNLTKSARTEYLRATSLARELSTLNDELERKVEQRTAELSEALDHLKRTQDDLIQSEKLASLGSMVAGISHELNTPIGNIVTTSSALYDRANGLDAAYQDGHLKKSELAAGLGGLRDMADLISRSANRAATLVASFKQVAVDQTSDRRREFELAAVVNDVVSTLRPGLKHTPWVIDNRIPDGIICDSFPGPLEQIITNLIQNAIVHGFAGRDAGTVTLDARVLDRHLALTVHDDGVGMNTATLVHIFDPFFTTKLGKGGSGIGLSICKRLAATVLAGELTVVSAPGAGASFILTIPLRTPGKI